MVWNVFYGNTHKTNVKLGQNTQSTSLSGFLNEIHTYAYACHKLSEGE